MRIVKVITVILSLILATAVFADFIPLEQNSQTTAQPPAISVQQDVAKLDQQMQNLTQMNLPQQIDVLRQQVQQLNGQVQAQTHQIQVLNQQLRNFYQDLDQRLNNLQAGKTTAKPATTAIDNVMSSPEDQAYQQAFAALSAKQYDNAVTLMQQYISNYSVGKYAANAHYWLGEIYYLQNKLDQAATEMQIVVKQFTKSPKVPDAMLKIAMIYNAQGKSEQARDQLKQIKQQFPNSAAAQLVDQQLQTIAAPTAQ